MSQKYSPAAENISTETAPIPVGPGGRRRKITACPTARKKRRKVEGKSQGAELNKDANQPPSAAADSNTIMVPVVAVPNNVELANAAKCESSKESSQEELTTQSMVLKKCHKVETRSQGVELNKDANASTVSSNDQPPSSAVDSDTSKVPVVAPQNNVGLSNMVAAVAEKCESPKGSSQEVSETDVAAPKPVGPGGRRRKITACPTARKKRLKVEGRSQGAELNKDVKASIVSSNNQLPSAAADSDTSKVSIVAPPNNAELTNKVIVVEEKCKSAKESSQQASETVVAIVTTVTEVALLETVDDSPILANNPSNVGNATVDVVPYTSDHPNCDSTAETILAVEAESQPAELPKIPHPKKCIVKIKTKSLSSTYRSKALEKLNHLKQNQTDGSEWPELDQNYVSMSDLIFLNPPAKVGHKLGMNAERDQNESVIEPTTAEPATASPSTAVANVEDSNNDNPLPVPQIRISEDGSVVVDEESLVLDTQKPQDPAIHTVYESGRDTSINQRSFMRRSYAKGIRWSAEETNEFYRCLRIVGAEFSLMSAMFRGRSPDDLRRKFRREHKNNPVRVDQALMQQHLSKWTDDMFKVNESNSSILKPPQETQTQL